jgi:hypothetical protein
MELNPINMAVMDAEKIMERVRTGSNLVIENYVKVKDKSNYALITYGAKVSIEGHHRHEVERTFTEPSLSSVDKINFRDTKAYNELMQYTSKLKDHLENYNVVMKDFPNEIQVVTQIFD